VLCRKKAFFNVRKRHQDTFVTVLSTIFANSCKSHCSGNQAKSVLAPAGIRSDAGTAPPGGGVASFPELFYSTSVSNSCYSSYTPKGSIFTNVAFY